ncbi:uncharacterized protein METZ01_LOCUS326738, partial [marine metagenome]
MFAVDLDCVDIRKTKSDGSARFQTGFPKRGRFRKIFHYSHIGYYTDVEEINQNRSVTHYWPGISYSLLAGNELLVTGGVPHLSHKHSSQDRQSPHILVHSQLAARQSWQLHPAPTLNHSLIYQSSIFLTTSRPSQLFSTATSCFSQAYLVFVSA